MGEGEQTNLAEGATLPCQTPPLHPSKRPWKAFVIPKTLTGDFVTTTTTIIGTDTHTQSARSMISFRGCTKTVGTFLGHHAGVPIISLLVLWGPLWGPPIPGNYRVQPCNPICIPSCHCVSSLMIIVTPSGTSCARNLAHITLGREKDSFCIYGYIHILIHKESHTRKSIKRAALHRASPRSVRRETSYLIGQDRTTSRGNNLKSRWKARKVLTRTSRALWKRQRDMYAPGARNNELRQQDVDRFRGQQYRSTLHGGQRIVIAIT